VMCIPPPIAKNFFPKVLAIQVGEEGHNTILDVLFKLDVHHPPLLGHSHGGRPDPLLITSKPPTCVSNVVEEGELNHLTLHLFTSRMI
jgi:hypothetical protein